jgi:foldase protein PrsA
MAHLMIVDDDEEFAAALAVHRLMACFLLVILVAAQGHAQVAASSPQVPPAAQALPPDTVATVNGHPILLSEVTAKLLQRYGRAALQVLMVDVAVNDAAAKAAVVVTEEELAARLHRSEEQEGGRDALRRQLAAGGVTVAQFREDLRRELLIGKLLDAQGKVKVTEQDIQEAYRRRYGEHLELSMILLETEAEAKEVERLLAGGADIGRLARERSKDPVSRAASGRLGLVARGDLLPELEEAVFALQPGEASRPLLSQYGYHIFKVFERQPAQTVPMEQVRQQLTAAVRQEKLAAGRSALVGELLQQAAVTVNGQSYPWVRPPEVTAGP